MLVSIQSRNYVLYINESSVLGCYPLKLVRWVDQINAHESLCVQAPDPMWSQMHGYQKGQREVRRSNSNPPFCIGSTEFEFGTDRVGMSGIQKDTYCSASFLLTTTKKISIHTCFWQQPHFFPVGGRFTQLQLHCRWHSSIQGCLNCQAFWRNGVDQHWTLW